MAAGYLGGDCVQAEMDAALANALDAHNARRLSGPSAYECDDCDAPIPEGRRVAVPGCRYCVTCQQRHDVKGAASMFNRRGSKDSQLR